MTWPHTIWRFCWIFCCRRRFRQERFKPIAMQLRSSEAKILGPRKMVGPVDEIEVKGKSAETLRIPKRRHGTEYIYTLEVVATI